MTISGSYPSDYDAQKTYMDTVRDTFRTLEAKSGIVTVHGVAEPSDAVLQEQWASQVPYAPPANGANLNWFNPVTQRIEQVYYPNSAGGVLTPYKRKSSNIGWEFITEVGIGTPALLDTGALYSIPQTYRHLLITWSARSSFAGTSVEILGIRFNNNTAATHQYIIGFTTSGANPNISSTATATFGYAGVVPQDNMTDLAQAGVGHLFIPNYSVNQSTFGIRPYHGWAVGFTNNARPFTKQLVRIQGYTPVTAPITRIYLYATTNNNLQRGSKMTIYGLK